MKTKCVSCGEPLKRKHGVEYKRMKYCNRSCRSLMGKADIWAIVVNGVIHYKPDGIM